MIPFTLTSTSTTSYLSQPPLTTLAANQYYTKISLTDHAHSTVILFTMTGGNGQSFQSKSIEPTQYLLLLLRCPLVRKVCSRGTVCIMLSSSKNKHLLYNYKAHTVSVPFESNMELDLMTKIKRPNIVLVLTLCVIFLYLLLLAY